MFYSIIQPADISTEIASYFYLYGVDETIITGSGWLILRSSSHTRNEMLRLFKGIIF